MKTNEVIDIVNGLNNDVWFDGCIDYYYPFELIVIDEYTCYVKFIGELIWSSEDDMREYVDDIDVFSEEKEPLRDYLIRESKKYIQDLKKRFKNV